MNSPLNLFRLYGVSNSPEGLENNVSRALAICLKHNPILLDLFMRRVLDKNDYHVFQKMELNNEQYEVDLQVKC